MGDLQSAKGETTVRKLLGKEVVGSDGNNVGRLHDLKADQANWLIGKMLVRKRRIRFGRKITIGIEEVASVGDKILLKNKAETYWR